MALILSHALAGSDLFSTAKHFILSHFALPPDSGWFRLVRLPQFVVCNDAKFSKTYPNDTPKIVVYLGNHRPNFEQHDFERLGQPF